MVKTGLDSKYYYFSSAYISLQYCSLWALISLVVCFFFLNVPIFYCKGVRNTPAFPIGSSLKIAVTLIPIIVANLVQLSQSCF